MKQWLLIGGAALFGIVLALGVVVILASGRSANTQPAPPAVVELRPPTNWRHRRRVHDAGGDAPDETTSSATVPSEAPPGTPAPPGRHRRHGNASSR